MINLPNETETPREHAVRFFVDPPIGGTGSGNRPPKDPQPAGVTPFKNVRGGR